MRRMNGAAILAVAAACAFPIGEANAAEKITWNISIFGNPRAVTAGIEAIRDIVTEKTGGNFELNLAYGETLSPAKENIDAVKIGAVEGAQYCQSYAPGKTPTWTVLDLPFLPLPTSESIVAVHEAFYKNETALEDMSRWYAMPYHSTMLPQYEFMGAGNPPMKLEDWKGLRVRALGGLGEAMKKLGAIPTTVPAPEVYTALERGMVQAASFPFAYAHGAYRLHEVSNWHTSNMALGTVGCLYIFGTQPWEALPDEYRQILLDAKPAGYEALKKAYKAGDDEYLPEFRERGLVAITYSDQEIERFREVAGRPVWNAWVEEMEQKGVPGRDLLDFVLATAQKAGT